MQRPHEQAVDDQQPEVAAALVFGDRREPWATLDPYAPRGHPRAQVRGGRLLDARQQIGVAIEDADEVAARV